jgi:hypothetical protein
VYAFSLVSPPPPNAPTLSGPYSCWLRTMAATMRSYASSQVASRSGLPRSAGSLRTSGVSSRSEWSSSSAAVQPLAHSPPLLTGNSVGSSRTRGIPGVSAMPHCSAQYGQCVSVTVTPMMLAGNRFLTGPPRLPSGTENPTSGSAPM